MEPQNLVSSGHRGSCVPSSMCWTCLHTHIHTWYPDSKPTSLFPCPSLSHFCIFLCLRKTLVPRCQQTYSFVLPRDTEETASESWNRQYPTKQTYRRCSSHVLFISSNQDNVFFFRFLKLYSTSLRNLLERQSRLTHSSLSNQSSSISGTQAIEMSFNNFSLIYNKHRYWKREGRTARDLKT